MAAKALELARKSGYRPVEAEALYRLGMLQFGFEETTTARRSLADAVFVAEVTGYKEYRARALVAQVQLEAKFSSKNHHTRKLAELAAAGVTAYGRDPSLQAELDVALGRLHIDDGDWDAAAALFDRAYATMVRVHGKDDLRVVSLLHRLAGAAEARGQLGRALALHQDALAILERQLGKAHPRVASAMESVALALRMNKRYDAARDMFARAARYWDSPEGRRALESFGLPKPKVRTTRTLVGRVVDPSGKPVAGAEVVASAKLVGDAKYLYAPHPKAYEHMIGGHQRAITDASGGFRLDGVSSDLVYIAAEATAGRSLPLRIAKATAPDTLTLRLSPWARLQGSVRLTGDRPPELEVFATLPQSATAPRAGFAVNVDEEGRFDFVRIPAGTYELFVELGGDAQGRTYSARKVVVAPGKTTIVDSHLTITGATIDVVVRAADGRDLGTLQLVLIHGPVAAKNVLEVRQVFAGASTRRGIRIGNTRPLSSTGAGKRAGHAQRFVFRGVTPGKLSVCTVPLGGDIKNPEFIRELSKQDVERIKVQCDPITVTEKPDQRFELILRD